MNKQPVSYLQTDPRWKSIGYSAPSGESRKRTIGTSGCGPSCAAMLITTMTGKEFTPADACAWSLKHGYKAPNQGTYYAYFAPQFKAHGISCRQLNWKSLYGKPNDPVHDEAFKLLKEGYYLIAVMGKGKWTSSGHFIVVWWADDKIRINDPNSTKADRLNGDPALFRSQVKYYWAIDARDFNKEEEEEVLTVEDFKALWHEYRKELQDNDSNAYSAEAREWAIQTGIVQGGGNTPEGEPNYMWEDPMTREQFVTVLYRFAKVMGKA